MDDRLIFGSPPVPKEENAWIHLFPSALHHLCVEDPQVDSGKEQRTSIIWMWICLQSFLVSWSNEYRIASSSYFNLRWFCLQLQRTTTMPLTLFSCYEAQNKLEIQGGTLKPPKLHAPKLLPIVSAFNHLKDTTETFTHPQILGWWGAYRSSLLLLWGQEGHEGHQGHGPAG